MIKNIVIFDLDQTVINSNHRNPCNEDGTLNLERYFKLKTRVNIFKDTLLPLAKIFKQVKKEGNYIIVATARNIDRDDMDFLTVNDLIPDKLLSRRVTEYSVPDDQLKARKLQQLFNLKQFQNANKIMFDDSKPVITKMRQMGIVTLNSVKVNKRLKLIATKNP
jgi:hypothetical protein|tara:strand:- start:416 stop:907 length:492 start_codon:yes stop_codon:yes gene_type:complete